MNLQIVILKPDDADKVLAFDHARLAAIHGDSMELEFSKWTSRSRREAVEHYLPMGWSFGIWQEQTLKGYFLGQPLLFYGGTTQSLWVETVAAEDSAIAFQLIDTAVRLAREKHFQQALFSDCESYVSLLKDLKGQAISETNTPSEVVYRVRTTKSV